MRAAIIWLGLPLALVFAVDPPNGSAPTPTPEAATRPAQSAQVGAPPLPATLISVDDLLLLERSLRNQPPVEMSPDEPTIARLTAEILPRQHYLRQRFSDEVSSKFLDLYLNTYYPQHLHFLKSDLDQFEVYRERLDDLTLRNLDPAPAYEIFNRFYERLEQRSAYVEKLLNT